MGNRKYPRLGDTGKFKQPTGTKCEACSHNAIGFVWVEFNYMRGDDEKYHVCGHHLNKAKKDFGAFLRAAEQEYTRLLMNISCH